MEFLKICQNFSAIIGLHQGKVVTSEKIFTNNVTHYKHHPPPATVQFDLQ